jgi:DNA invertase Pin-like site-specific DNA recombinase
MNRSRSSLTISSGVRTCTFASPQCGRSSRTSRAQNANTLCAGALLALGWRDDQIIVIDNDQGESGASAAWREGFQRLVTDVGMGQAGIVMGLEVSRLARNNADWHRRLEICALADTLILDEDGVYDPASFNDRLLLGLKGTMSEAELHVLKARLRGGILNKVRRGEYHCPLPTGFVYDEAGNVVLDPDAQIRETIATSSKRSRV